MADPAAPPVSEADDHGAPRAVVGLGNPGERYRHTRHNVGFEVVEELARRCRVALEAEECNARVAERDRVLLALPQTYMNRSGHAVRCLCERRGLTAERLLIVYDELHLPLGRLRLRPKGSPAGHRGMESVLDSLRTDRVARLRLGIAPAAAPPEEEGEAPGSAAAAAPGAGDELIDFVLSPFDTEEREAVEEMVQRAADACELWLAEGAAAAMNRYNG